VFWCIVFALAHEKQLGRTHVTCLDWLRCCVISVMMALIGSSCLANFLPEAGSECVRASGTGGIGLLPLRRRYSWNACVLER
jgi:hypothetical protein